MKNLIRKLLVLGILAIFSTGGVFAQRGGDKQRPPKDPGKFINPDKRQPPPQPPPNRDRPPKGNDKKKPRDN